MRYSVCACILPCRCCIRICRKVGYTSDDAGTLPHGVFHFAPGRFEFACRLTILFGTHRYSQPGGAYLSMHVRTAIQNLHNSEYCIYSEQLAPAITDPAVYIRRWSLAILPDALKMWELHDFRQANLVSLYRTAHIIQLVWTGHSCWVIFSPVSYIYVPRYIPDSEPCLTWYDGGYQPVNGLLSSTVLSVPLLHVTLYPKVQPKFGASWGTCANQTARVVFIPDRRYN